MAGKAKTGSGKTLAFGIPAVARASKAKPGRPTAVVLVPTRELAVQVGDVLEPLGRSIDRAVGTVYGGAPMEKQIKALQRGMDVVVATPGRLIGLMEDRHVDLSDVEILVLDEADRMADMGFMPQVQIILHAAPEGFQLLLFSATLDGSVNQLLRRYANDPVTIEVGDGEPTVDQMIHRFFAVHNMDKPRVVARISDGYDRTLAFCQTKRGCAKLEKQLRDEKVRVVAIHGDLSQGAREKALARFTDGDAHVLVATDVAARGIHVDDVDVVIHYDPPIDDKTYLHRSGRTARAGSQGIVASMVEWNQKVEIRALQHRLNLAEPIVEAWSNDDRLIDLEAWDVAADEPVT